MVVRASVACLRTTTCFRFYRTYISASLLLQPFCEQRTTTILHELLARHCGKATLCLDRLEFLFWFPAVPTPLRNSCATTLRGGTYLPRSGCAPCRYAAASRWLLPVGSMTSAALRPRTLPPIRLIIPMPRLIRTLWRLPLLRRGMPDGRTFVCCWATPQTVLGTSGVQHA